MKKRDSNIKQHYVPQFYLKNFVNSNGGLCVYDIKRKNHFLTSPAKECYKEYFYDLDLEIFKMFTESNKNYEELVDDNIRLLNENISSILINFLKTINEVENKFYFPREDRNKLYDFITLQIIRTPFYRDRLKYLNVAFCIKTGLSGDLGDEKTQDLTHNLLLLGVLSKLYGVDFKLNKLYFKIFDHLIDEICNIKLQLEKSGKLFLVNKTEKEFICASTPINVTWKYNPIAMTKALLATHDDQKLIDIGDYIEFQTIHLPISSDVSIFLFNKEYNFNLTRMNQGIGLIDKNNSDILLNLNYSTMLKNGDKIYSSKGDYDELINMYSKRINPKIVFRFGNEK